MFTMKKFYMADDGIVTGDPTTVAAEPATTPDSFEAWFEKQPEEIKEKFKAQYGKLSEALDKERKANKEAKPALTRLAELEAAEEKRKADSLSAEQKLQNELEAERKIRLEAEQTLQTERLNTAIMTEASKPQFGDGKSKFVAPEDTLLFIGQYGEVKFEDGKVVGVLDALKKLATAKPHLLEKPSPTKSPSPVSGKRVPASNEPAPSISIPRL